MSTGATRTTVGRWFALLTFDARKGRARASLAAVEHGLFGEAASESLLGRFEVIDRVGSGGMGVVYRAHDPRLQRRVALKLVKSSSRSHDQLLHEARVIAKLAHPNVITVYDAGTVDDEVFIAMELVEGEDLRSAQARPHDWREILALYRQAGAGLAAAHAAGIIHGDFKPENALLGGDGRVRVADFGLARAFGADTSATLPCDAGTPAYMAPEQRAGASPTPASDQFSFCVAFYEALAGRHPFAAPPHDTPAPRGPRWLRDIITRGMQSRPVDRWPSMAALLTALDRRSARRRATQLAGAGTLVLGLVTGFAIADRRNPTSTLCDEDPDAWTELSLERRERVRSAILRSGAAHPDQIWMRVERHLRTYEDSWLETLERACTANRTAIGETTFHAQLACLESRAADLWALADLLAEGDDLAHEAVGATFSLSPAASCGEQSLVSVVPAPDTSIAPQVEQLRRRLGGIKAARHAGRPAQALLKVAPVLEAAEQLGYEPLIAEIKFVAADCEAEIGRLDDAVEHAKEAVWLAQAAGHDAIAARAAALVVWILGRQHASYEQGREWFSTGLSLADRLGSESIERAHLFNNWAAFYGEHGDHHEAIDYHRRALEIKRRLLGPLHMDVAISLNNLGISYSALGDFDRARNHLEHTLADWQEMFGPESNYVGYAAFNLAEIHELDHRDAAALEGYRAALRAFEAANGSDNEVAASSRLAACRVLLRMGRLDEAAASCDLAAGVLAARGFSDALALDAKVTRAAVDLRRGRHAEAYGAASRALTILEAIGSGETNVAALGHARFVLAQSMVALALDHERARELARRSAEDYRRLGPGHRKTVEEIEKWVDELGGD